MSKSVLLISLTIIIAVASCRCNDEALNKALLSSGDNKTELEEAISHYKGEQREAVEFLIKYMPEHDLKTLSAAFLIENIDYAYKARKEFPWAVNLEKDIFFNDVLPYTSLNERRDRWRPDFFERFKKYVKDSTSIEQAIWTVNNNILKELKVEYNTRRNKPDQSPYESMEINMASCSGLSILLVDAFRAVGIPARIAGTPNWYNNSGNHNWVEVYVNGQWHFTEYYPTGKFNESWFLERAGKANEKDPEQWIYASSFKPTGLSFPLVWDKNIKYIHAHNVTDRYIELYNKQYPGLSDAIALQVVMLKNGQSTIEGNNRVKSKVELLQNNTVIDSGFTSGIEDDMNRYLTFKINKNQDYQLRFTNSNKKTITRNIEPLEEDKQIILEN